MYCNHRKKLIITLAQRRLNVRSRLATDRLSDLAGFSLSLARYNASLQHRVAIHRWHRNDGHYAKASAQVGD